jgi:hypothetical protein
VENLKRHEKMAQIHLFGEFRRHNAGHFDGIDPSVLRPEPA